VGQARSTGAVHLFKNVDSNWTYKQTLFHPTPLALQTFGNAISMRGGMLAVGSWGSSGFAGRVFVHTLGADDVWTLTATLEAADPQPNKAALFGWSVSIDMPTGAPPVIAVGRPNDSTQSSGAIYMFEFDGTAWTQAAKLLAPSAGTRDQLGLNVSVCNGTVCGGIPLRRRVAIFERTDGVWGAGVEASDEASVAGDSFGTSVASGGSFVAVGSANRATEDGQVLRAGAVIVFEHFPSRGGLWEKSNTPRLPTPIASDNFGYSLAAAPTGKDQRPTLIVGAPGFDSAGDRLGVQQQVGGRLVQRRARGARLRTSTRIDRRRVSHALHRRLLRQRRIAGLRKRHHRWNRRGGRRFGFRHHRRIHHRWRRRRRRSVGWRKRQSHRFRRPGRTTTPHHAPAAAHGSIWRGAKHAAVRDRHPEHDRGPADRRSDAARPRGDGRERAGRLAIGRRR